MSAKKLLKAPESLVHFFLGVADRLLRFLPDPAEELVDAAAGGNGLTDALSHGGKNRLGSLGRSNAVLALSETDKMNRRQV